MSKVVVFGSMNMDLTVAVERVPSAGETVLGSDFLTNAGGKGGNQAVAAARLGADVLMIGAVGVDSFGDEMVSVLEGAGIDCSRIRHLDGVASGVGVIMRSAGDNRIVVASGANLVLSADEVTSDLKEAGRAGDVFLVQGECDPDATAAALHEAHGLGLYTVFNTAPASPVPDEVWRDVDLVCLNETECEVMCGILPGDDGACRAAADRLRALGAGTVVITLGSQGSFAVGPDGGELRVPAVPTQAVDTTGAGDTFIGALVAGKAQGLSLEESMRRGSAASSISVGRLGAQQAIPSVGEVEALMAAAPFGDGA